MKEAGRLVKAKSFLKLCRLSAKSRLLLTHLWTEVVRSADCGPCDRLASRTLQTSINPHLWLKDPKETFCAQGPWLKHEKTWNICTTYKIHNFLHTQKIATIWNNIFLALLPVLSWELWRCQSPPSSSCLGVWPWRNMSRFQKSAVDICRQ